MSIPQTVPKGYNCGLKCSTGYYAAPSPTSWNTTLKQCKECGKGYECPDGVNRNECLPGTFSSSFTASSCAPCPTGSTTSGAAPFISNSQCSACLGGYEWKNNKCSQCSPGTFAAAGRNTCEPCPKNTYSLAGAGSCTRCMGNQITWSESATKLSDCQTTCPTGLAPFPQCDKAIAGYEITGKAGINGSLFATATKCPIGHFKNTTSASPCSDCPIGTYADSEGATSCTKCPSDKPHTKVAGATDISFCISSEISCYSPGSTMDTCSMGKGTFPLTTDCTQELCSNPGQLCQVPGKNVYSCCAYTLPKSEMDGGTIPSFDKLPMKWQSMGTSGYPVKNGGCLNYSGTQVASGIAPSDVGGVFANKWTQNGPTQNVFKGALQPGGAGYLNTGAELYPKYTGYPAPTNYKNTYNNRFLCNLFASSQNIRLQTPTSAGTIHIYFEGTGDPNTCAGSESKGTPPTPSYYVDT